MIALIALVAQAATPVPAAAPTPAAATAPERKVCWREQVTGSMMPGRKICMTVEERRAWAARMQGNVDGMHNRTQRACSNQPGCPGSN